MSNDVASPNQRLRDLHHERLEEEGPAAAAIVPLLSDYLEDVSRRTEARLGRVAGVAVTLSVDNQPWTVGASTELAADVDLIQYEIGVGPCLLALREGVLTYAADLGSDRRWGSYGARAAARGAASCISVPVLVDGRPAAVIKVYSSEIDGLTPGQRSEACAVALEVAGGIGLAINLGRHAQLLDDREAAMHTRRVIDLAIGILMERSQGGAGAAFAKLRTLSQHRNIKLRDAAQLVLGTVSGATEADARAPFNRRDARPAGGSTGLTQRGPAA